MLSSAGVEEGRRARLKESGAREEAGHVNGGDSNKTSPNNNREGLGKWRTDVSKIEIDPDLVIAGRKTRGTTTRTTPDGGATETVTERETMRGTQRREDPLLNRPGENRAPNSTDQGDSSV